MPDLTFHFQNLIILLLFFRFTTFIKGSVRNLAMPYKA